MIDPFHPDAVEAEWPEPVFRLDGRGGWGVVGHPEAVEVLTSPERFTSSRGTRPGMQRPAGTILPLHNLDPPAHGPVRRVAVRSIGAAPGIEATARSLVRRHRGHTFEAVAALAAPLATAALGEALSLAMSDATALADASAAAHRAAGEAWVAPTELAWRAHRAANEALAARIDAVFPHHPLAVEGTLDARRRRDLLHLLVQAGWVTTVDAVAGSLALLAHHPAQRRWPAGAVDELLRLVAPIHQFGRTVVATTHLGGCRLVAGEQVVVFFGVANRDPRVFADPHRLRLTRRPCPHLSFGAGPHRCPGARLGRRVLEATLRALLDEGVWPSLAGAPVRRRSDFLRGLEALPLHLGATPDG